MLHRGVMQAFDDRQAIHNMLWACATLGYVPSTRMLQDFEVTLLCFTLIFCMLHLGFFYWPGRLRSTQGCP